MKKLFTLVALTLVSIWGANAQSFGVRGGGVLSGLNGETINESDMKAKGGFYVGAFVEIPIGTMFALQPEVIYSQQGAKWKFDAFGESHSATLNMNYINVPVMFKVKLGNLALLGGAQLGFLVSDPSINHTFNGNTIKLDKNAFSSLDFGVGTGLEFAVTNNFLIDLRYTHGLVNTFDENNTSVTSLNISDKNDFKNSVLTLGIGLKF